MIKRWLIYFFSFLIPIAGLSIAYLKMGIYPTGDHTILICDMRGQYVDFYATYYDILTKGQSLLYSWKAGMGLNFIGLFAYYLSSPFSLLILLFDRGNLPEALLFITLLKIGTSGLTFSIYCRYVFKVSSIAQVVFSVLYALMSYSIVYSFNLMWLDGVVFLPLILLGTEKILREGRSMFFLFGLIFLFIANFYIAYMVCFFSFLYFLAAFFANHSSGEMKLFFDKLLRFVFSGILAAGCSAILLIPTFYALKNGQGGPALSLINWNYNDNLSDLIRKLQLGSYDTLSGDGFPNIYCGLLPLLLSTLYFFNRKIPRKEKVIYAFFLGFMMLSFTFNGLDILWHGFDHPNSFPYRYSFVFSFLVLFLALRSFDLLEHVAIAKIVGISLGWILIILVLHKLDDAYLSDKLWIINFFLIGLYSCLLIAVHQYKNKRPLLILLLAGFVLMESTLSTLSVVTRLDQEFSFATQYDYNKKLFSLQKVIADVQTMDQQGFYRLDRVGGRSYNDPMNLNYKGITHFSSMSNVEGVKSLRQLGLLTTPSNMAVNFAGSTPITESLFGIKYVISATDKGLGYKKIMDQGEYAAYINQYFLPLGFMADQAMLAFDPTKHDNPFTLQNELVNLLLGNQITNKTPVYFVPIPVQNLTLKNAVATPEKGKDAFISVANNLEGSIEYTLENPKNQQVYACFQTIFEPVQIFINDTEIKGYLSVYNKRIVVLGYHAHQEKLHVRLVFKEGFTINQAYFYGLDQSSLERAVLPLQKSGLEDVVVTDTQIRGRVNVMDKTLLFTSILYDPGWRVFIDGREGAVQKIGNTFIGVTLPEGEHQVTFRFHPKGLGLGIIVSAISSLVLLFILMRKQNKHR